MKYCLEQANLYMLICILEQFGALGTGIFWLLYVVSTFRRMYRKVGYVCDIAPGQLLIHLSVIFSVRN